MAMDFGLTGYDAEGCKQLFEMLRPLRIAAGDFEEPEPPEPGAV
jgi:hypothetical protein